ncbi:unnamed protein product [Haemonchus placei]|uniref:Uncharacterized protein n=1 Tax=Haemonchus placei TaxID=6290 RepID=A0A158QLL4_HAEPC|nr:unnamed protein product [Haemonchus placei]
MSSAVEPPEVEEALYAQSAESDDPNHEEILQRCLTDSKYMYESVIVARLWDLTQQKPSTSHLKLESNEMTDSGFSRSTRSKHSHEPRSLFDSAIGGELFSSEDESVDKPGSLFDSIRFSQRVGKDAYLTVTMARNSCDEIL